MGLHPEPLPNGRGALVTLPFGPAPLPTLGRPRRLEAVRFATVGTDRIKCLAPRVLFYLPLIPITDCETREDLEARIRDAWRARLDALRRARGWLEGLGVEAQAPNDTPQWTFPLPIGDGSGLASCTEPGKVVLPSVGALAGVALEDPKDRTLTVDRTLASAVDLEIAITNQIESLGRAHAEREARRRQRGLLLDPPPTAAERQHLPPVLLLGPGLEAQQTLHESLRLRGFRVSAVRSIQEAVEAFQEASYELVLAEASLDRGDGIETIPAIRGLPGMARVPVVIVDDRFRQARRETAREAGASGYLTQPLDVGRLAPTLTRLVTRPRHRRFTRYARPLAVCWRGTRDGEVAAVVGRGGMFVRTEHPFPQNACERFEMYLPDFGQGVAVESEIVYRLAGGATSPAGVGIRFRGFPDGGESLWIAWLRSLEPAGTTG